MWFRKFLYILFLYFFLFSPPVAIGSIRLYLVWLIWPLALYSAIKNRNSFGRYIRTFRPIFLILVYLLIFSLLRELASGQLLTFRSHAFSIMLLIFVPFYLITYGEKFCADVNDYVKYILVAEVVAVGISMLCFIEPSVDNFVRFSVIEYREGELGYENFSRGFGFGASLTSLYSFVIAMIVALGLFFKGHGWFYWTIPFSFLVCLINARTGVFIIFVAILLYFLFSGRMVASLFTAVLGALTWIYIERILGLLGASEATIRWIMSFENQVDMMSSGDVGETTVGFLWNKMLILPKDMQWLLIGNGYSLFGGQMTEYGWLASDIGFVNQLSFGGLFYAIPMYYMVYKVCKVLFLHKQKLLSIFIMLAFLIINFKGKFLVDTNTFALSLLMYYLVVLYDKGCICKDVSMVTKK